MITNIIDNRKRKYLWARLDVVIEPTWHDNSVKDSDIAEEMPGEGVGYEERSDLTLRQAVQWAEKLAYCATLYVYDHGSLTRTYSTDALAERLMFAATPHLGDDQRKAMRTLTEEEAALVVRTLSPAPLDALRAQIIEECAKMSTSRRMTQDETAAAIRALSPPLKRAGFTT